MTENEIKTINFGIGNSSEGEVGDNSNTGEDNNSGTNTPADNGSNASTQTPETKVPETTAPESENDTETAEAEKKSGCGAVIVGWALIPVALVAGGACIIKRKK